MSLVFGVDRDPVAAGEWMRPEGATDSAVVKLIEKIKAASRDMAEAEEAAEEEHRRARNAESTMTRLLDELRALPGGPEAERELDEWWGS
jgi:hypothetical protein